MRLLFIALLLICLSGCDRNTDKNYLALGNAAMAQNKYAIAVIEFKNAVRQFPQNGEPRFLLGQAYLALGQLNLAEKEFKRALDYNHPNEQVVPLLSVLYQRMGDDKSLFSLSKFTKGLKPKQLAQLTFYQLQSYVRVGQHNKAFTLINEIKRLPNSNEYGQLALAYDLVLSNNLQGANLHLQQVLETYPNQKDALLLKAQLHLNLQEVAQGVAVYQQYIDVYPDADEVKLTLARLYSDFNLPNQAEPIVDDLLNKYSNVALLLQLKAAARLNDKDYSIAYDYAEQAITLDTEDTSARLIAGISAYFNGDKENAHRHLSLIAGFLPIEHPALRLLADSQLYLGMSLDANDTVSQFKTLSDEDSGLLSKIGQALLKQGEINKVKTILDKQPDNIVSPKSLTNVGLLKLSLRDVSGLLDLENAVAKLEFEGNEHTAEQLQLTLAQAYLNNRHYDKALLLADEWQNNNKLRQHQFLLRAKIYQNQKKFNEAKQAYQRALDITPDNPAIQLAVVNSVQLNSRSVAESALNKVQSIINQHPDFIPAIIQYYTLSKQLNLPDKMVNHLQARIKDNKNHKQLVITLAKIQLFEGQAEKAIKLFEQIKSDKPESYWRHLAMAYSANQQYDKTMQLYETWYLASPNNPQTIIGLLQVLQTKGELESALQLSQRYLYELGGRNLEIRLMYLQLLTQMQQFEQAETYYATLTDSIKKLPFVKGIKGQLLFHQGKASEALENITFAYEANPTPQNAGFMVAAHFKVISHNDKVNALKPLRFLKEHLKRHPKDIINTLYYAQLQTGVDNEEAIRYFRKTLILQPDNFVALNNIAYLLLEDKQHEEAYQFALNALQIRPKNIDVLDTIGEIALRLDKLDEALAHYTEAYNLVQGSLPDDVLVNYFEVLFRTDQTKLAQRRISQHPLTARKEQVRLDQLLQQYL